MGTNHLGEVLRSSFKQALQLPNSARKEGGQVGSTGRAVLFWGLVVIWSYLMLGMLSFAMLWLGDKFSARDMALTRFWARIQAPITAQYHYPETARDQITVVMYDQQFLENTHSAWPLSYQDHADWLLRLAEDPNARPKAIFLDVTFGQNRSDPSLPVLQQALCTLQNELKVPVFLAALPSPVDGQLRLRSGLNAAPNPEGPPCFTLVGVDYVPDSLDGVAWTYELSRHFTGTGWQSGVPTMPAASAGYRSAAMVMAQDVAHIELGEEAERMALIWGYQPASQADRPDSHANCRAHGELWKELLSRVVPYFGKETTKPLCPYHRTLSMDQIGVLSEQELAPYLAGRYVMVGAHVPGYNDFVDSPVHGLLPGVHLHAMALDNFLSYQGEYKLDAQWTFLPSGALAGAASLSIAIILSVHMFWYWLGNKYPLLNAAKDAGASGVKERILNLFRDMLRWLLRIALFAIAAMGAIVGMQFIFRIGMLPVAELVGMMIVAEGLDYMKKLQTLLYGESAAQPVPVKATQE